MKSIVDDFKRIISDSLFVLSPIPILAVPLVLFKIDMNVIMILTVIASLILMSKDLWKKAPKPEKSKKQISEDRYDLFTKQFDNFALGAITTQSDEGDLLTSHEIAKNAAKLYKAAKK